MTSFAKFILTIGIVAALSYLVIGFDGPVKLLKYGGADPILENTHIIYIHNKPKGYLALRNKELSSIEYRNIKSNKELHKETFIKRVSNNEEVVLIKERENSFYIRIKDGEKGYIPKKFAGQSTLIKID